MNTFNCARIIPALAGNTRSARKPTSCSSDHPRSRGEYVGALTTGPQNAGSSPLSRGILRAENADLAVGGIIPALAGNTLASSGMYLVNPDHPRSRGEYWRAARLTALKVGSSPLSRGIQGAVVTGFGSQRIIPALAGNTITQRKWAFLPGDHPRSRGEYVAPKPQDAQYEGSSPLSRGILSDGHARTAMSRIIPALAGNTTGA